MRQKYQITNTQANELILRGKVKLKGAPVLTPGLRMTQEFFDKHVDCDPSTQFVTYAINKPVGVLSKPEEFHSDPYVIDLLPPHPVVNPSGRLDKDSSGLLIASSDGKLVWDLIDPNNAIEKEYIVEVNKPISQICLTKLSFGGLKVLGQTVKPCKVFRISESSFRICLIEGKNRQIRRMCRSIGLHVVRLHRVRIGSFVLPQVEEGFYKILNETEISMLLNNPTE